MSGVALYVPPAPDAESVAASTTGPPPDWVDRPCCGDAAGSMVARTVSLEGSLVLGTSTTVVHSSSSGVVRKHSGSWVSLSREDHSVPNRSSNFP
ncbi:hypothetical protein ACN24L_27000 [Streptomyces microflavus]